jgi:cytidylate kinase
MESIDIITIEREFGAGGSELAAALGARLGWRVVDRSIVPAVAARLAVDEEAVAARDEHAPGLLERIGTTILRTSPEIISVAPDRALPDPETVADAARAVLRDEAERPPVILVGHGASVLFRDRPGTLHVRLAAPLATRVARICPRVGCDGRAAASLAQRVDADRASYVRRYFRADWQDPLLFHVQLNTGLVEIAEAAALIADLVEARGETTVEDAALHG